MRVLYVDFHLIAGLELMGGKHLKTKSSQGPVDEMGRYLGNQQRNIATF